MSDSFVTPWAYSPLSSSVHGILWQEYWSGLPFPPPGGLPNSEIEPASLAWAGGFFTAEPPGKPTVWRLKIRVSAGLVAPEAALLGMSTAIFSLCVCVCVCVCVSMSRSLLFKDFSPVD